MANKYIAIDGDAANGGTAWNGDAWTMAKFFLSAVAGDVGHVKHPTLNGDDTSSGSTSYTLSDRWTMTAGGTVANPIILVAYDVDDNIVTDFTGANKIDMTSSSNAIAVVHTAYNWYHGFEWQNSFDAVFSAAVNGGVFTLNYFHDNGGQAIISSGSKALAAMNKIEDEDGITLGADSVACLNDVNDYAALGISLGTGSTAFLNKISNPSDDSTGINASDYARFVLNSLYGDDTVGAIKGLNAGTTFMPFAILNIIEGFDNGVGGSSLFGSIFNVMYDNTSKYSSTPDLIIDEKTADPAFEDEATGDLTVGNSDYLVFGPGAINNNIGAVQGGEATGASLLVHPGMSGGIVG